jgi:hypothetical protein
MSLTYASRVHGLPKRAAGSSVRRARARPMAAARRAAGTAPRRSTPQTRHMKGYQGGALRLFVVTAVVVIALWDGWILLAVTAANFQGNPVAVLLNNTVIPTLWTAAFHRTTADPHTAC